MKYVFEKYEFGNRGRIFLGYETAFASSSEEAREKAQEKVGKDVTLAQIFVPQDTQ